MNRLFSRDLLMAGMLICLQISANNTVAAQDDKTEQPQRSSLTPAQKAAIATRFAAEVKYNFADYDKFGQDFDSICHAELPSLIDTPTDEDFNNRLVLLANRLNDGHTGISWSADVSVPPFLQKRIGDKVFVTDVFSDVYSDMGIRRGTEIVEIDDVPVIEYGERYVVPYVPSSTPQWAAYYPFSSVNLTKGKRGSAVKLLFRNDDGKEIPVTDRRDSPWDIIKPDTEIKFDSLPGNIGLLTIPTLRSYGFDARKFYEMFNRKILPTDGLIIDMRDNTGGDSNVAAFIMQLLATDTIPQAAWETPEYEATYASWGKPWHRESVDGLTLTPFYMQDPEVPKYDKPIVLLINSGTFSASEDFAVLFKNASRGIVMGTPSGGSTGNPINIDLGWGYYARICTRHERLADGTEFIGIGIQPDIYVEETESVLYDNDNVIAAALEQFR